MVIKPANLISRAHLNRQSPLSAGLAYCYFFGSNYDNLVGSSLTLSGSNVKFYDDTEGRAVRVNEGGTLTTRLLMTKERAFTLAAGEEFTAAIRFITTDTVAPLWSFTDSGSSILDLSVGYDGTNTSFGKAMAIFRAADATTSTSWTNYGNTVNDGKIHTLAVRRKSGTLQISLDGAVWVNFSTGASNDKSATFTPSLCTIGAETAWINSAYGDSPSYRWSDATFHAACVWKERALTDADIRAFHKNPYVLLKTPTHRIWSILSSGAATYNRALTASSAASLLNTSQVNVTKSVTTSTAPQFAKTLSLTKALVSSVTTAIVKSLDTVLSVASSSVASANVLQAYLLALAASTTASPAVVKAISITKSVASAVTSTLTKAMQVSISAIGSTSALLTKQVNKVVSVVGSAATDLLAQMQGSQLYYQVLSASSAITSAVSKNLSILINALAPASLTMSRYISVITSTASAVASMLNKQMGAVLTASTTATVTLAKAAVQILVATSASAVGLIKQISRVLDVTSTVVADVFKSVQQVLIATASNTASLAKLSVKLIDMIAAAVNSSTIVKSVSKAISAPVPVTVNILRSISVIISRTVVSVGVVTRTFLNTLFTTVASSAAIVYAKLLLHELSTAVITVVDNFGRHISKSVVTTSAIVAQNLKEIQTSLTASATTIASAVKRVGVVLEAAVTTPLNFAADSIGLVATTIKTLIKAVKFTIIKNNNTRF